ncbi:MAG: hypothetical protein CGW95_03200 [Phenylobacterium zucineum]|nr:MAG: hypothetical protein CGW95_03200 [Phenylobacterium zucineum]
MHPHDIIARIEPPSIIAPHSAASCRKFRTNAGLQITPHLRCDIWVDGLVTVFNLFDDGTFLLGDLFWGEDSAITQAWIAGFRCQGGIGPVTR